MENRSSDWLRSAFSVKVKSWAVWILWFICADAVSLVVLSGCAVAGNRQATPTPIPPPVIPVKPVYEVQVGDIVNLVKFTGRVAPIMEVELAFGTNGRVDQVLVQTGDTVQPGDLLAILDTGSQKFDLRRAEIALELAQFDLDLVRQQQPVASQANSMTVIMKERLLVQFEKILNDLIKAGYTGRIIEQAEDDVEQARLDLDLARQQAALNAAEVETELVVKERLVELAQIALEEIQAFIADSQIQAPFDGQVVSVYIKEDTAAEAYKTAIILVDTSELEIRAVLGGTELKLLQEGMLVSVSSIGRPGTVLKGIVSGLPYPYGSGKTGEDEVRVTLDPAFSLAGFKLGDLMEITVIITQKSDILWLPPQAIRTFEGRKFVVIQEGEGQRRVDVKIGIQAEDRVEILEGLERGQIVLSP